MQIGSDFFKISNNARATISFMRLLRIMTLSLYIVIIRTKHLTGEEKWNGKRFGGTKIPTQYLASTAMTCTSCSGN